VFFRRNLPFASPQYCGEGKQQKNYFFFAATTFFGFLTSFFFALLPLATVLSSFE